jgi:hypothetical protein
VLAGFNWSEPIRRPDRVEALLSSERLARLTHISLRGPTSWDSVIEILDGRPGSGALRELGVEGLSHRGVAQFLSSSDLSGVDSLAFASNVDESFVHQVGEMPFRWRKLDLGQSQFHSADLSGLGECQRLDELFVDWCHDLSNPLPLPPGLKRLHLNWGSPAQMPAALSRLAVLPKLEWLYFRLDENTEDLRSRDASVLGDVLRALRGPVFHFVAVGHYLNLIQIATLPAQDRFRRFVFHADDVSNDDVASLAECGGFTGLHSFNLRCPLTPQHLAMLAEMPFPPSLRRLTINSPLANDAGLATLLRSPYLERLTYINLRGSHPGLETLAALAESSVLPRLRELILPHRDELDENDHHAFRATPGLSPLFRIRT